MLNVLARRSISKSTFGGQWKGNFLRTEHIKEVYVRRLTLVPNIGVLFKEQSQRPARIILIRIFFLCFMLFEI